MKVISPTNSLGCCAVFVVLVAVLVNFSERGIRRTNEETPLYDPVYIDNETWHTIANDIPPCNRPVVYRNALKYPHDCKGDNRCTEFMVKNLEKAFGDRYIQTLAPVEDKTAVNISFDEFINNPKYFHYTLHAIHGIGTYEEYQNFFKFNSDIKENNFSNFLRRDNDHFFMASQLFMRRGKGTGSQLHFAVGQINIFTQLSGRKRWLMVSPFYLDKLNCTDLVDSVAGNCAPGGYFPYFSKISVDRYKELIVNVSGVPEEYIVDVTLNPGDTLINCIAWPHAIENLDDTTTAFSFRLAPKIKKRSATWYNIILSLKSLKDSIYLKFTNPSVLTVLDIFYHTMIKGKVGYVDTVLGGKTIVRQNDKRPDATHSFAKK